MKRIIVVGGNAAGPAAAAKAKRIDRNAEVILFEATEFISTGTCEMPFVLSGKIEDYKKVVFFDEDSFYNKKGVKVYTKRLVESINRRERTVSVLDLTTNRTVDFQYDKLILTTGAKVKKIPPLATGFDNLFYLKSIPDLIKIQSYISSHSVKNVLIFGAGYIGLESAESFVKLGMNVTIVELESLPLPGAESEIRNLAAEEIKKNRVTFLGAVPYEFIFEGNRIKGIKAEGRIMEFDLVLSAIGFSPNSALAEAAGLELGKFRGIKVDKKLKTSDSNIFAAGDNTEIINAITGKADYLPLATTAYTQSHIAGENAAGGNKFALPVIKNIAVKIFDKTYASVGITEEQAREYFFRSTSVSAIGFSLIHVMPESEKVFGKLVFDKESKRILGASFWGAYQSAYYADTISALIRAKSPYTILDEINFNYTPPVSPFINILNILGKKANDK